MLQTMLLLFIVAYLIELIIQKIAITSSSLDLAILLIIFCDIEGKFPRARGRASRNESDANRKRSTPANATNNRTVLQRHVRYLQDRLQE